ncbi:MAG: hypothetical protein JAZ03_18080, partial [Candidatus Thiodiazotropha taylori]|nr:hypothetical protein [Candidatus Thiodiazotropha taylori]MCW4335835.1 hypothetical protein [Candidatus Thiodiazotropha endolucinida]
NRFHYRHPIMSSAIPMYFELSCSFFDMDMRVRTLGHGWVGFVDFLSVDAADWNLFLVFTSSIT